MSSLWGKMWFLIFAFFFIRCQSIKSSLKKASAPSFPTLAQHMQKLGALPGRFPGSINHKKAQTYIYHHLTSKGFVVYGQEFQKLYQGKLLTMQNIIAYKKGEKDRLVLIGTHYDTRRFSDKEKNELQKRYPVPGGNDGSSGTALLLSMADALHQKKLSTSLLMAFFDAEDQGEIDGWPYSLGARKFAASPQPDLPDVVVIVDMICDPSLNIYYEANTFKAFPELYESLWGIAEKMNDFEFIKKTKYAILDDHIPFARLGIPSALIIDFDYRFFHTVQDTMDQCSKESIVKVGRVVWEWLKQQ